MRRERLEDVLASLLARSQIAAFAEPQHHVEEAVLGIAVSNRIMLAAECANADAAEREDAGLDGGLAHDFDHLSHVESLVEVGGVFDGEMRHGGFSNSSDASGEITAHRAPGAVVGLDGITFAGLDRPDKRT